MIIFVMTGCNHFRQHHNRIGNGATVYTTMQIAVGSCYFYFDIAKSTHTGIERRCVHTQQRAVADEDNICFQQFFIGSNKLAQIGRTYFFFTFNNKFDIGSHGVGVCHYFHCFYVHVKLAFVVCTATCKNFPVDYSRFKRRGFPFFQWFHGLHIVVTINQYCRFGRINNFFSVNNRVSACFHYFGLAAAGG